MTVDFDEVVETIDVAVRQVEADSGASPVLVAVVREFEAKLAKAKTQPVDRLPTGSRLSGRTGAGRRQC